MTDHLSEQDITRYRRRTLAPAELLRVDAHLADCDTCHQQIVAGHERMTDAGTIIGAAATLDARTEIDHLTYEQFVALVDGSVDEVDREIAEVHLQVCAECSAELADLRALKAATQSSTSAGVRHQGRPAWIRFAAAAVVVAAAGLLAWNAGRSMWRTAVDQITMPPTTTNIPPDQPGSRTPALVVALKDGAGLITVDDAGNIDGLAALSGTAEGDAVKAALTTKRLNIAPALEGLRTPAGPLMGAPGVVIPFGPTEPLGVVVRTGRPALRWQALEGAESYVVRIYDTKYDRVAQSDALVTTEWTPTSQLPRGAIYVWQVTAMRDGTEIKAPAPPTPEARFKVLGPDDAARIDRLEQSHRGSHLALGTAYAQQGLLSEAEREFRALLAANPDAQVVKDLLNEVVIARRR